ncbi:hypothetical protein LG347_02240 [Lactiplantibacillus plantarum]|uniref:hypothetical protein n=1 Tax=Lactiplantibacillus plantarum TaxID=1590 RepID=UPI001D077DDC|nr:hypothetical protein [Lactiplantibacillus plantarum]MCB7139950.1 hypothetical protein [Lactiplantibacillus plantarum]MCB7157428.1 hypothetical protein [Lactiplantibacillus plantarum]MCB7165668.1 hypothetical protein [Lactiplantibacillus plantarum]MCB7167794.1 hypothetical protein [Lactiplantibacillus plantarum]MCB7175184.1 hypothetical protein [Lactiplantibacillus plantarum]
MKIYSHKPFKEWQAKQNPRNRVQPVTGTRLKNNQIILQVYGTPRANLWQQLKGTFKHE